MRSSRGTPGRAVLFSFLMLIPSCGDDDGSTARDGAPPPDAAGGSDGSVDAGGPGPEPSPWTPPGQEDGQAFAWGVLSGDAEAESVWLGTRTLESQASLVVMRGTHGGWEEAQVHENLSPQADVIQVQLTGLAPDTTYAYAFYSTDRQRRSRPGRFRTALAPGASRVIRFGGSHGLGGNMPWPSLLEASTQRLDFFMLLGDTIYADWGADVGFVEKFKVVQSAQGFASLAASTSFVAAWDDHEVEDNWSYATAGMEAKVTAALAAFREALPQGIGPGGTGIWRKLTWGSAAEIYILDCRGERRDGNYLSPEQMTWLKAELLASEARFKFIVNSVPITDFSAYFGSIQADDRWQGYPAQRSEILTYIAENGVGGVLWITGDFHVGGVVKVDAAGGPADDQWEVMTGPAGSPINSAAGFVNTDARLPVFIREWSYTLFEADPSSGQVAVSFIDDDGGLIDEITLTL